MFGIGVQELVIVLVIVLVLFGGKKLPELTRGIGQSLKEIKKGFGEGFSDDENKTKKTKLAKKG